MIGRAHTNSRNLSCVHDAGRAGYKMRKCRMVVVGSLQDVLRPVERLLAIEPAVVPCLITLRAIADQYELRLEAHYGCSCCESPDAESARPGDAQEHNGLEHRPASE